MAAQTHKLQQGHGRLPKYAIRSSDVGPGWVGGREELADLSLSSPQNWATTMVERGGQRRARKRYSAEDVLKLLREIELKLSEGTDVQTACRAYKMLTVLDEYTRQALAVEVRTRITANDVLEVLYGLFLRHGKPEHLRSDNGPEFTSEGFKTWLQRIGVEPIRICPGSPWENGYNERFNGTLRREVLSAEWFATAKQTQVVINAWFRQYNHTHPDQATNMRPPVPETLQRTGPVRGG